MISVTGRLICSTGSQVGQVRGHVAEHIRLAQAEPGCVSFSVVQTDDPMGWQVDEVSTDRQAFASHQTRAAESDRARASKGIKRDFTLHEA